MCVRTRRGKRGRCRDLGNDRAVAAAVVLTVTIVLLLTGFSGSSVDLSFPGPRGWIYIGVVMIVSAVILVRLFRIDKKRKR